MTRKKRTTIKSGMPIWSGERVGEIVDITPLRYALTYNLQDRANIRPHKQPITNICSICGKPIRWGDSMNYREISCGRHFWTHYPVEVRAPRPVVIINIVTIETRPNYKRLWQQVIDLLFRRNPRRRGGR